VNKRKCEKVTCHCRKVRPYRVDLSLLIHVTVPPVVIVKPEMLQRKHNAQNMKESVPKDSKANDTLNHTPNTQREKLVK